MNTEGGQFEANQAVPKIIPNKKINLRFDECFKNLNFELLQKRIVTMYCLTIHKRIVIISINNNNYNNENVIKI